jgi:very-short-patch-repair endonuclease
MPRNLTSLAKGMRSRQTKAEARLWSRQRDRRLDNLKFRRQVPRGRFVVDFLCDEAMLVLEVDGSQHDENETQDRIRTAYLESLGYLVVRFRNFDVLQNTDRVLDHVYEVAAKRRKATSSGPSGHPLPTGRRGAGACGGEPL